MKKWGLRILSAILTFTTGLCAATLVRFRLASVAKVQPANIDANIKASLPPLILDEVKAKPTQITDDTQPKDEVMKPHLISISPYEIKRLIDEKNRAVTERQEDILDLRPIWERLGINKSDNDLNQSYLSCQTDVIKLELDGKPGKETMLRFSDQVMTRYLIFKQLAQQRSKDGIWELLGYIDAFTRWSDLGYRIITAGTKRWLAVGETAGHGSGFDSRAESWYEVDEDGVTEVLSYQTSLFEATYGPGPGIDRKTRVLKVEHEDDEDYMTNVTLESVTSYEGYLEPYGFFPVWKTKRKALFTKSPKDKGFVFVPILSEMPSAELNPNFGDGVHISDEEFLGYNSPELWKIVISRDTKRKEWLRNYLDTCDDSPEKQSLQKALEGTRP